MHKCFRNFVTDAITQKCDDQMEYRSCAIHALSTLIENRRLFSITKLGAAIGNKDLAKMIFGGYVDSMDTSEIMKITAKIIHTYHKLNVIVKESTDAPQEDSQDTD